MLESTRAGLKETLFPPKLNAGLEGRHVSDLGAVDVVSVEKSNGAILVKLVVRAIPDEGVSFEILPVSASEFVRQVPKFIDTIDPSRRSPAPVPVERKDEVSYAALGEVAFFQIAPTADEPEMYWSSVERPDTARCSITTGQLQAMRDDVAEVLAMFTPEDHKARLVDLTSMGRARTLTEADGELPVGAFLRLTLPTKP